MKKSSEILLLDMRKTKMKRNVIFSYLIDHHLYLSSDMRHTPPVLLNYECSILLGTAAFFEVTDNEAAR